MLKVEDKVYARHGDVLIKECTGAKIKGRFVASGLLHKGEQHSHVLRGGSFRLGEQDGHKVLQVKTKTTIKHDEHGPIPLKQRMGDKAYVVEIQEEYDHFLNEARQVID